MIDVSPIIDSKQSQVKRSFKFKDITGQTFGRWTVIEIAGKIRKRWAWKCMCACGTIRIVEGNPLRNGSSCSCGCLRLDEAAKATTKHGQAKRSGASKEYKAWRSMLQRCRNTKAKQAKDYVGRGITVCKRWETFDRFLSDLGVAPSALHTIERINNDLGYCPGNVKWETRRGQANNTRRNVVLEIRGRRATIAQWAREIGADYRTIYARYKAGWKHSDIIEIPIRAAKG